MTCDKPICRDCAVTPTHRVHDYQLISDLKAIAQETVLTRVARVKAIQEDTAPSVEAITNCRGRITQRGVEMKREVIRHTEKAIEQLRAAEQELISQVDVMVDRKCEWLDRQHDDISSATQELERVCSNATVLVHTGIPLEVVRGKSDTVRQLQAAVSRVEALVLIPVEGPGDMEFTTNTVSSFDLGTIQGTYLYTNCSVSLKGRGSNGAWVVGVANTLILSIATGKSDLPSLPSCLLQIVVESVEQQTVFGPLSFTTDQSEYTIQFTAHSSGKHNVRVYVCNNEITGSPVPFHVTYSPRLEGRSHTEVTHLDRPHGCVLVQPNTLAVAEYGSHCVTFIDLQGNRLRSIGSKGTAPGQFTHPRGVALSADRTCLLVTDNHRLQKLTLEGVVIGVVGGAKHGTTRKEFYNPTGIAVDMATGNIYVADTDNDRIQVLNNSLEVIKSFGRSSVITERLQGPYSIALDNAGDIYVADSWNHCVKKYTASGRLLHQIGSQGTEEGRLDWPTALAFNTQEYLYVTEQNNKRVSVFTKNGELVCCYSGSLGGPQDICVDDTGNVYISDTYSNKLHIFYTATL